VRTLVVLPTYQEAENIEQMLESVRKVEPEMDILVIDDGSPDGTADLAEVVADELGQIEVVRRSGKLGLGSAYRLGFSRGIDAGYDAMVEMDSDLSHDPTALPSFSEALEAGADLVIGSRYVPGGRIPGWPWERRLLSLAGNIYADRMLRLGLHDATAGYRMYRADALRAIDLDTVHADGYSFQIEMAYRILRAGGRVVEVPITFTDRLHGSSKMSLRIVIEAIRLVTLWGIRDRLGRPPFNDQPGSSP
jgi:glycosyltransferase involved in cell wall biosynthesis